MPTTTDDLTCRNLYVLGALPPIARSALTAESYSEFDVPLTEMRIWDAFQTVLTTAASDDLGLTAGAYATGIPYITAGSLGSAGATTRYCRFLARMPMNYVAGQAARVSLLAGITGSSPNVADASCTVDLQAFKSATNVLVSGSDLISTSATSMNVTSFAAVTFDLTVTSLSPGDLLDYRINITCTDAGSTAANVVPAITKVTLQCGTKG